MAMFDMFHSKADYLSRSEVSPYTSREVETSSGKMTLSLRIPEALKNQSDEIFSSLSERGPVANWIKNLQAAKTETTQSSKDIPQRQHVKLEIHDFVFIDKTVQFASVTYHFKPNAESTQVEKRFLQLRPDASAILVIVEDDKGNQSILTQSQFRDGAGSIVRNETPAGTADKLGESAIELIIREMGEETALEVLPKDIKVISAPLYSSQGTTSEKISGFEVTIRVTEEVLTKIRDRLAGHDVGEAIRTELVSLPKKIDVQIASPTEVLAFIAELDSFLNTMLQQEGGDSKLALLLSQHVSSIKSEMVAALVKKFAPETALQPLEQLTLLGRTEIGGQVFLEDVDQETPAQDIVDALQLPQYDLAVFLMGGANGLDESQTGRLRQLIVEVLSTIAVESNGRMVVGDGGTESGIMDMAGDSLVEARKQGHEFSLIGVAPKEELAYTGYDGPGTDTQPENNHTHIIPVSSKPENIGEYGAWGNETSQMYEIFAKLANEKPNIAIAANGGGITLNEIVMNLQQGRKVIVLKGTGRGADGVAALMGNTLGSLDPDLQSSKLGKKFQGMAEENLQAWSQNIIVFDMNSQTNEELLTLLRGHLGLSKA